MKIMNWLKKEFMKTPGYIRVQIFLLTILATSSVTSTSLLMKSLARNTLAENTLPNIESLEVQNARLRVRVTGRNTTEVLKSLKKTLESMEETFSEEKY